ncbi:MAG TPA: response regulator transcription factor [Anaerolineae bacterium]|mgnify:CR=1 FL=1|nr:response regulator transcription factor [Anaerolineae bacterium]
MTSKEKIRLMIVDDHSVVRKGLIMVLRLEPDFEIVGEAENGRRALELARQLKPDLVMLDLVMPEMDGKAAALALQAELPLTKILVLTGVEIDEGVVDVLASGVDGYVPKDIEPHELANAIRTIAQGEAYLHPAMARRVLEKMSVRQTKTPGEPQIHLTPRESEVLRYMASPATYREIADQLFVSEETIRSHAKHILGKLNQPNRAQAVLAAVRAGLINLPD